jgi:hypothetical protein
LPIKPDDLAELAVKELRAHVRRKRRTVQATDGKLVRAYIAAMDRYDAQKAAGVPFAERVQDLEEFVRAEWPFTRTWMTICAQCGDTGLVMATCRRGARCRGISTRTDSPGKQPGKYQRLCARDPDSDYEHTYGIPCACPKGTRFTTAPKPAAEDFVSAGKSKPMTRLGRR